MNVTRFYSLIAIVALVLGCSDNEPQIKEQTYTGNESTYPLESSSEFNITGVATFKERMDQTTDIFITLDKTFDAGEFPVHLHFGDVATDQADIASLLIPVDATKGSSQTTVSLLADESKITFDELKKLDACVKIHLSATGEGRDIVLVAGNIGKAFTSNPNNGRVAIGLCKSE
jgi:hypothetical protein